MAIRCQSVRSWRAPLASFHLSVVATLKRTIRRPSLVVRTSGSAPRLPIRVTRLTVTVNCKRKTRRRKRAGSRITGHGHRRPRLSRQAILSLPSLGFKYPGGLGAEPPPLRRKDVTGHATANSERDLAIGLPAARTGRCRRAHGATLAGA